MHDETGLPGATYTEELYNSRTDETLGTAAKAFRDAFCMQYIKDFRGDLAIIRCGHKNPKTAKTRASQLLREPYVRCKVDDLVNTLKPEDVVTRQQVMAKMWLEANDPSNMCSTRVNATAHCAKMLGMVQNKETPSAQPLGVLLVPAMSMEEWERNAAITQQYLKQQAATQDG